MNKIQSLPGHCSSEEPDKISKVASDHEASVENLLDVEDSEHVASSD